MQFAKQEIFSAIHNDIVKTLLEPLFRTFAEKAFLRSQLK